MLFFPLERDEFIYSNVSSTDILLFFISCDTALLRISRATSIAATRLRAYTFKSRSPLHSLTDYVKSLLFDSKRHSI